MDERDVVEYERIAGYAPATRGRRRLGRWLVMGGLALALTLALGVGVFVGAAIHDAQAAGLTPAGAFITTAQPAAQFDPFASGTPSQCATLTVSSVSGSTILATEPNGTTVTIHTAASTTYTRAGLKVTASAITAGERIQVAGTRNSDGSISASSITIG